jgi:pimeloyl-ACP methyl ester carboxylesterase
VRISGQRVVVHAMALHEHAPLTCSISTRDSRASGSLVLVTRYARRMVIETDLVLGDGRTLHAYDAVADGAEGRLAVFWHHGTPNVGGPPEPLFPAAARSGIRWVSYDRPGYGGSTPHPGRDMASTAADVASVADALGIERFAVMGHSGGAAHALACAALLPQRVLAAVCASGLAPYHAEGLDWFAGMGAAGAAELRCRQGTRAAGGAPGVRRV